ncbi:helix-turn-helix domain-containing protein [Streptomyces sp. PA5.6]|uniref:helix-turn-helix domain-containing protein n=1 Tax=Streptomyces sp. PA5.6 TaxID=3035651 RepID=UPI003904B2E0
MSSGGAGAESLAELLRGLKERSGLSYGVLARRLHLSTSAVHRYCNGDAVPAEFVTVERFVRLCAASPGDLVEAHRLWVLADTGRGPRGARSDGVGDSGVRVARSVPEVGAVPEIGSVPEAGAAAVSSPQVPYPRRRVLLLAAVLAAAVGISSVSLALHGSEDDEGRTQRHIAGPTAPPPRGSAGPSPSDRAGRGVDTDRPDAGVPPHVQAEGKERNPHEKGHRGRTTPGAPQSGDDKGGTGTGPGRSKTPAPGPPLTTRVRPFLYDGCAHNFLVNRAPGAVPEPPAEQDVPAWVGELGAVSARHQYIEVTVQGTGKDRVVLDAMDVRVRSSDAPLPWNNFEIRTRCDDQIYAKSFTVDLDEAVPRAAPMTGQRDFPYTVSESGPQVFLVTAGTALHDVRWYLDLKWSSGKRHGVLRVDDQGKPFRTSGHEGRPTYTWLGSDGWGTEPP